MNEGPEASSKALLSRRDLIIGGLAVAVGLNGGYLLSQSDDDHNPGVLAEQPVNPERFPKGWDDTNPRFNALQTFADRDVFEFIEGEAEIPSGSSLYAVPFDSDERWPNPVKVVTDKPIKNSNPMIMTDKRGIQWMLIDGSKGASYFRLDEDFGELKDELEKPIKIRSSNGAEEIRRTDQLGNYKKRALQSGARIELKGADMLKFDFSGYTHIADIIGVDKAQLQEQSKKARLVRISKAE